MRSFDIFEVISFSKHDIYPFLYEKKNSSTSESKLIEVFHEKCWYD